MIRSRSLGTNVGLGSSIEIFAASGPHFPRERTQQQTDHRTATAGWPIASLALTMVHTPDFPVCSGAGRRRLIHRKLQGLPATRQGGELQRQRWTDHDRGSKSELADASTSSRSPPLTEAKAGRNCSAQDRPVAQPCFTRRPGVGPIRHEAKGVSRGAGSRPDRHISDSPSV